MHRLLIRVVSEFRMALSAFMRSGSSCRSAPITLKLFRCSSVWLHKAPRLDTASIRGNTRRIVRNILLHRYVRLIADDLTEDRPGLVLI